MAELGEILRGDHAGDGVEVLLGQSGAFSVTFETKECDGGVSDLGFGGVEYPLVVFTHLKKIPPSFAELGERHGALGVVIHVSGGAGDGVVGEVGELGEDGVGGGLAGIFLAEDHPDGLDGSEGGV